MSARLRSLSSGLIVLVASLALLVSPLLAKGKLDIIAKFQQSSLELAVATYTDADATPGKVGLVGLTAGQVKNSFAFDGPQWASLIDLIAKAAKAQSTGNTWAVIGELTESETTDVSHLVISAGPGIRFALNSPKGASLTYMLPKSDIPRLQQALGRVRQYLAAP
jgi:hypothetical protein